MPLDQLLNLELAFRRVRRDQRDDPWPDVVQYNDYAANLDENLARLRENLRNPNTYQTQQPAEVNIPKPSFTLRPGLKVSIDDRIIYQAIADYLAPHFQPEPCVYSNQLADPDSPTMFLRGIDCWLGFQAEAERLATIHPYIVFTDLTAYFEHINHYLLRSRISDVFRDGVNDG